jgi:hypothetical protein
MYVRHTMRTVCRCVNVTGSQAFVVLTGALSGGDTSLYLLLLSRYEYLNFTVQIDPLNYFGFCKYCLPELSETVHFVYMFSVGLVVWNTCTWGVLVTPLSSY